METLPLSALIHQRNPLNKLSKRFFELGTRLEVLVVNKLNQQAMKKDDLIFIIEDDLFYAQVTKSFLEFKGFTNIEHFATGEDGLAHLYKYPKMILLDYNLGEETGLNVLLEIAAFDPNVPVIIISAQQSIQDAVTTLKLGAFDYIPKNDSTYEKLEKKLSEIMNQQKTINDYQKKQSVFKKLFYVGASLFIFALSFLIG